MPTIHNMIVGFYSPTASDEVASLSNNEKNVSKKVSSFLPKKFVPVQITLQKKVNTNYIGKCIKQFDSKSHPAQF